MFAACQFLQHSMENQTNWEHFLLEFDIVLLLPLYKLPLLRLIYAVFQKAPTSFSFLLL
jgi:hypothetical protein